MGHKCFVSYKKEDDYYKKELVKMFKEEDIIDKTLDRVIDSQDGNCTKSLARRLALST